MDVVYEQEFDAKRYGRIVYRTIATAKSHEMAAAWCFAIAGCAVCFVSWLYENHAMTILGLWLAVLPWLAKLWWLVYAGVCVKILIRQMNGITTSECHLTDERYEVRCGNMEQKVPWTSLATHYHFFDDDTVALTMRASMPSLIITDLADKGIDRRTFETVLRNAGLRRLWESKRRKVRAALLYVFGVSMLLLVSPYLLTAIFNCEKGIRADYARERLLEAIRGGECECNCPQSGSCDFRTRIIRAIAGNVKPDELLYIFDDSAEEDDKARVLARYGNICYEARMDGCVGAHMQGHWNEWSDMFERVNPIVFREDQKEEWLEKLRARSKQLEK